MKNRKIIVISDVHLRSDNCQAKLLLETLKNFDYEILLIVGDLIEDDKAPSYKIKMKWDQFQLIEYLRERLRKQHEGKSVIRILGNHDPFDHDFIGEILGIESRREYRWEMAGKKFCAIHGHQFDRFVFRNAVLSNFIAKLAFYLQKIDSRARFLTRKIDSLYNKWYRLSDLVARGAIDYAYSEHIDIIICGHTHESLERRHQEGSRTIEYWNSGDWTGHHCGFLTITESGEVERHMITV